MESWPWNCESSRIVNWVNCYVPSKEWFFLSAWTNLAILLLWNGSFQSEVKNRVKKSVFDSQGGSSEHEDVSDREDQRSGSESSSYGMLKKKKKKPREKKEKKGKWRKKEDDDDDDDDDGNMKVRSFY